MSTKDKPKVIILGVPFDKINNAPNISVQETADTLTITNEKTSKKVVINKDKTTIHN